MTRVERLQNLKSIFLNSFVEDPFDGTAFDLDVLNTFDGLINTYQRQEKADQLLSEIRKTLGNSGLFDGYTVDGIMQEIKRQL